jgi:hypothetical protein
VCPAPGLVSAEEVSVQHPRVKRCCSLFIRTGAGLELVFTRHRYAVEDRWRRKLVHAVDLCGRTLERRVDPLSKGVELGLAFGRLCA